MIPFPFTEIGSTRIFKADVDPKDLQWHWDEQDRMITVEHETTWLFQFDNALPCTLDKGVSLFIKAGIWHRLIKGNEDLTLTVLKL